jgi:DNA-binding transcriptional MocR family regulator
MSSTRWTPSLAPFTLERHTEGVAIAICNALVADIASGVLLPGDALPTQRLLAKRLGISLGSVHRGYRLATDRGLIRGEVGRGSFVLENRATIRPSRLAPTETGSHERDLSRNLALPHAMPVALQRRLRDLVSAQTIESFLTRDPSGGTERARAIGTAWVGSTNHSNCLVLGGAQIAINASLAALTKPGDTMLTDSLTYPGLRLAANLHGLRVVTLPGPIGKPDPTDVRKAIKQHRPSVWFCIPTVHNPTATMMPSGLRAELADVANQFGLAVVEDETYTFLTERPVVSLAEQCANGVRIVSLSKSMLAGARIAYVVASNAFADRINDAAEAMSWMTHPPTVSLISELIESGLGGEIAVWKRHELGERVTMARTILGRSFHCDTPASLHGWLRLPQRWIGNATSLTAAVARRGVRVAPADEFAANKSVAAPNCIRVSLGGPSTRESLNEALTVLAETLRPGRRIQPADPR